MVYTVGCANAERLWILGAGTHLDTVGTEERLPIVVFDYTAAKEDLKRIGELGSLLL
jgi:hypothetical protein